MSTIQCCSCKKYGHISSNYPHKFYNYCKQQGHIIKDCTIHPSHFNKVYLIVVTCDVQLAMPVATSTGSKPATSTGSKPATSFLTREMVQEMIVSAVSTLGLQVTSSSSWILESSASNHMTNSLHGLSNVKEYCGSSHIQTTNGSVLPIMAVVDM